MRRRCALALLALSVAACSTVQLAYDIPCRRGDTLVPLRVWVVPDWGPSSWGMYMLLFDVLLPFVDLGVSGYYAIDDLANDHVRTRGGPALAPFVKLAAMVLPCVSSYREPLDVGRALLGVAWAERGRKGVGSFGLVLPANATLEDAQRALLERITVDAAEAKAAAARIVEVEWGVHRRASRSSR